MVLVPDSILFSVFKRNMKQGAVFRYKGDPPFESNGIYHVFAIVFYDRESETVFLINGTTSIANRVRYLSRQGIDIDSTTVTIKCGQYGFFSRDTLFDCNSVHQMAVSDIKEGDFIYIRDGELDSRDVDRIKGAIVSSRMTSPYLKKCIGDGS